MKKELLIFLMSVIVVFTGCTASDNTKLVSESSGITDLAENNDMSTETGVAAHVNDDWSNWVDGSIAATHGISINLYESKENNLGINPISDKTVIDTDNISFYLAYKFDITDTVAKDDVKLSVMVFVNDKLCDFTLGDLKSETGIITTDKEINKDFLESITVNDCELIKGDNKIQVVMTSYFPQVGFSDSIQIIRNFKSNNEKKIPEIYENVSKNKEYIELTNNDDLSVLGKSNDFVFNQCKYEESKNCSHINTGTKIDYFFVNSNDEKKDGVDRGIIYMVLENGKPIVLPNQMRCAVLSLNKSDFAFETYLCELKEKATYTHLTFCLFDMSDDSFSYTAQKLFYTE